MMPQIAATKNYTGYVRRQREGVIVGVESKEAEGEDGQRQRQLSVKFFTNNNACCVCRAGPEAVGQRDKARGDECFMLFYICWQLTEWSVGKGEA